MNEMYKYLREHNYISRNENKDALRQQELSRVRAECIANKYDNLTEELRQENKQLKIQINAREEVCDRLEDNWNKLKEYLFDIRKRGFALQNLANVTKNTEHNIAILIIINKMQKLERSDSND